MKFICTQENLNHGLSITNHITNKNTTLPILNNVLLKTENGLLKLSTTNLEIGINCLVRGRVEEEGSFTVNAKLLSDYVNLLPKEQISLEVKDQILYIECKNHKTKINGTLADEFPVIPEVEKNNFAVVSAKNFKKSLSQVLFAVASDETRPEISGVFMQFNGDLVMAGTDGYRLAEKKVTLTKGLNSPKSLILPNKTAQELIRSIVDNKLEDNLEIVVSDNQIKFIFDSTEIISRIIDGQYPDYRQVIPEMFKTKCATQIEEFSNLVKGASLFCQTGLNDIHFIFKKADKNMVIKSANSQLGEYNSAIETDIDGEDNEISFNYRYILDGLANIDEDLVEVKVIDTNHPCLLRPAKKDDYVYVIMPIRQ